MGAAEHTPGPWIVSGYDRDSTRRARVAHGGVLVADCWTSDRTEEEQEANARLIAHAPELLEALNDALIFLDGLRLPNDHPALKDRNDTARMMYETIQRAMGTALEDDPFPGTEDEDEDDTLYNVFHRTWWVENPAWPNGLEPGAGERTYLARRVSYEEARELCKEWNSTHDPGRLSRKAEFEEA